MRVVALPYDLADQDKAQIYTSGRMFSAWANLEPAISSYATSVANSSRIRVATADSFTVEAISLAGKPMSIRDCH